jgi:hypothetical protein
LSEASQNQVILDATEASTILRGDSATNPFGLPTHLANELGGGDPDGPYFLSETLRPFVEDSSALDLLEGQRLWRRNLNLRKDATVY